MLRPDFQAIGDAVDNHMMFQSWYQMDELMEKLKLLNYERTLLRDLKTKPLHRFYFAKATNSGEQFYMFTSICAWLIRKTGRDFEQPQEFHDPSKTVGDIVRVLQEFDISTDFPTNKLMQGAGFVCVYVLDSLATQALKVTRSNLQRLEITVEEDVVAELVANEGELILEKVEEEQMALLSDGDSEAEEMTNALNNAMLDLKLNTRASAGSGDPRTNANGTAAGADNGGGGSHQSMLDSESWRLELERVLPQLKVVVKTDPRDWRAHWELMKSHRGNIETASEETLNQLQRLRGDIQFAMEKIESREKHLNNDLAPIIAQYKNASTEHGQLRAAIKEIDDEKLNLEQTFDQIGHELENVKIQMEQRGNAMADGSPLINIKRAISKIKEEIVEMELDISVLRHSVDQDVLKKNAIYAEIEPTSTAVF